MCRQHIAYSSILYVYIPKFTFIPIQYRVYLVHECQQLTVARDTCALCNDLNVVRLSFYHDSRINYAFEIPLDTSYEPVVPSLNLNMLSILFIKKKNDISHTTRHDIGNRYDCTSICLFMDLLVYILVLSIVVIFMRAFDRKNFDIAFSQFLRSAFIFALVNVSLIGFSIQQKKRRKKTNKTANHKPPSVRSIINSIVLHMRNHLIVYETWRLNQSVMKK